MNILYPIGRDTRGIKSKEEAIYIPESENTRGKPLNSAGPQIISVENKKYRMALTVPILK